MHICDYKGKLEGRGGEGGGVDISIIHACILIQKQYTLEQYYSNPNLDVTPYPTEPFPLDFNGNGPLDSSPIAFNVYSSFLSWCFVFQIFAFLFFCDFCHLVDWFSNGFTFHYVLVSLFSIHKVKELFGKMKVEPDQLFNLWPILNLKPLTNTLVIRKRVI